MVWTSSMGMGGFQALQGATRRIRRRWAPGALVLAYHRVHASACDPWSLAVSPDNFRAHLELIRRHAWPASLTTLTHSLREGRSLRRGVVVTFDDGYVDNLTQALPLLAHFEVPATVFIASAFLNQEREFWWDELEHLLLHPGRLPQTLELNLGGQRHRWELGAHADWTPADFEAHRAWLAGGDDQPTQRHRAFAALHRLLGTLADADIQALLGQLRALSSEQWPGPRPDCRPLTCSEVVTLDRSGWMAVGAHTRTHPQLDRMAVDLQRDEILGCKADLETLLQRPVRSMAYPYGRYSPETPGLAQALGFQCACTVEPGDVQANTDPFRINRVVVCNWTGDEFARRLGPWMDFT